MKRHCVVNNRIKYTRIMLLYIYIYYYNTIVMAREGARVEIKT